MSENTLLETATTVMINKFNLDEIDYAMFKYSEGKKNVTIGMTNGEIPVTATFPRDFLRLEEMKTWSEGKVEMWMRNAMMNGTDIPDVLIEEFPTLYQKIMDNPRGEVMLTEEELRELEIEDGSYAPEETQEQITAEEVLEETAEEFEEKVEGKKKPKGKSKKLGKKAKKVTA